MRALTIPNARRIWNIQSMGPGFALFRITYKTDWELKKHYLSWQMILSSKIFEKFDFTEVYFPMGLIDNAGIILGMGSANERRRYIITPPLIGWAHTQNALCNNPLIYLGWYYGAQVNTLTNNGQDFWHIDASLGTNMLIMLPKIPLSLAHVFIHPH